MHSAFHQKSGKFFRCLVIKCKVLKCNNNKQFFKEVSNIIYVIFITFVIGDILLQTTIIPLVVFILREPITELLFWIITILLSLITRPTSFFAINKALFLLSRKYIVELAIWVKSIWNLVCFSGIDSLWNRARHLHYKTVCNFAVY